MDRKSIALKNLIVFTLTILLTISSLMVVEASIQGTTEIQPGKDQYLELKATAIRNMNENGKQLIMELWGYDIDFSAFDVRFTYDTEALKLSDLQTNAITDNEDKFFEYEDEFKGNLLWNMSLLEEEKSDDIIRLVASVSKNAEINDHIVEGNNGGKMIKTTGEAVKLGIMSFKLEGNGFDIEKFALIPDENHSPNTGVKINIDALTYYSNISTFRFSDETASKDANLVNIVVSSGEESEDEDLEESTYKIHPLVPGFDQDIDKYTVTLYDYLDEVDITATQSDPNSSMKIKVPKRDSEGNLVYDDSGGGTIQYEEEDLINETPFRVTLNKLGEEDTIITIIVTAEDGSSQKEYEITIKRPYGIIKGNIHTILTEYKEIYKCTVRIYNTSDIQEEKDKVVKGTMDDFHQKLLEMKSQDYETDNDGNYIIYVVPGTYDILLDKPGYLDHIYESREVKENETIDLGSKTLLAGDVNKNGVIEILDMTTILDNFSVLISDENYDISMDFNEDESINILDLTALLTNYSERREFE